MSFEFDDDDEEVARARFDRLAELLDVVRANTKEINEIAAEIREATSRRTEYVRLLRAYREQRAGIGQRRKPRNDLCAIGDTRQFRRPRP